MCCFAAKISAQHDHSNMLKIHAGPQNPPVRLSLYRKSDAIPFVLSLKSKDVSPLLTDGLNIPRDYIGSSYEYYTGLD